MPRRNPLPLLAVAAVVPALLLGVVATVAAGRAEEPPPTTLATVPVLPPVVAAPLLSVRRAPEPLAADVQDDTLGVAAAPVVQATDSASCFALAADGRPLVGTNGGAAVIPASTLKVVVAAVALEVLGAEHRFTTEVRGAAPVGGVVAGDLVLVGGGDPVLGEAWYAQPTAARKRPPLTVTGIEALADAVVAAGVTEVAGRVLGDDSRYDAERFPPGWAADLLRTVDFPPIGALTVNDTTDRNDVVGGDPPLHAARVFSELLRARGVRIGGDAGVGGAPVEAGVLAAVQSAPLGELVRSVLATSDNGAAEMLLKELGRVAGGQGTRAAGITVLVDRLVQWGVPVGGVSLTDGSGLSRDNRMTCEALLAVLRRTPAEAVLGQGLAVAGEDGTTLADQLETPGVEGVLRAKTGSLTGVKALAGYFPLSGRTIAFVLVLNGPAAADYATAWDRLTDTLLAGTTTPAADRLAPGGAAPVEGF